MTFAALRVARVSETFSAEGFDCGEWEYNTWLVERAWDAVRSGSAAVYLLVGAAPDGDERVVGYYAICPTLVVRADLPTSCRAACCNGHRRGCWLGWRWMCACGATE